LQGKEGDGNELETIMPRGTIPHYLEAIQNTCRFKIAVEQDKIF